MFKITGLNFWLASTLEIRFTTPAAVKKLRNAGNYSRLAFKFYCVSMTQLLHMYATLGNHSNWSMKLAVMSEDAVVGTNSIMYTLTAAT